MAISISRSFFRIAILTCLVTAVLFISSLFRDRPTQFGAHINNIDDRSQSQVPSLTEPSKKRFAGRLDLSENDCRVAFPGATKDIDETVTRGKFVFGKSDPDYKGFVQGRIKDGKLHVLTVAPDHTPEIILQRTAILHQIHRALLTSPSTSPPLPDTTFAFAINDYPKNNTWSFAKPNKSPSSNIWLMPHFGFWAWGAHGSMDSALARIALVEEEIFWDKKVDKAVWRGTPWFNPLGHPRLRQDLLGVTKGKEWADVQALDTGKNGTELNGLKIEEFCKYKYVVYTEGVTYSGRLMYHQACGSVLLMVRLTWVTSTAELVRPVDAEDLMAFVEGREEGSEQEKHPAFNGPADTQKWKYDPSSVPVNQPLLPVLSPSSWQQANSIYVHSNFSNLEATISFLRRHPNIAQTIARNQREMVIGRGYLSEAAEVCYWRALIRGWASATIVDKRDWGEEMGERFESWVLKEVVGGRGHG